jgi:hypothetical protein
VFIATTATNTSYLNTATNTSYLNTATNSSRVPYTVLKETAQALRSVKCSAGTNPEKSNRHVRSRLATHVSVKPRDKREKNSMRPPQVLPVGSRPDSSHDAPCVEIERTCPSHRCPRVARLACPYTSSGFGFGFDFALPRLPGTNAPSALSIQAL